MTRKKCSPGGVVTGLLRSSYEARTCKGRNKYAILSVQTQDEANGRGNHSLSQAITMPSFLVSPQPSLLIGLPAISNQRRQKPVSVTRDSFPTYEGGINSFSGCRRASLGSSPGIGEISADYWERCKTERIGRASQLPSK